MEIPINYIEFFGYSGSGKTTIAKYLEKKYKFKERQNININKFRIIYLQSLIQGIKILINIIIITKKVNLRYFYFTSAMVKNYYDYYLSKKIKVATGHGFIQTLSQFDEITLNVIKNKKLYEIVSRFPKNIKFVYIDNDINISKNRAKKRNLNLNILSDKKYLKDKLIFQEIKKTIKFDQIKNTTNKKEFFKRIKNLLKSYQ